MATFKISDTLYETITELDKLADHGNVIDIMKRSVYDGAAVVADEMRAAIEQIPAGGPHQITEYQKEGLRSALGISSIEDKNNTVTVSIGFNGYNDHPTKRWPQGQPNAMVARSLVKGTSWLPRNDFVGKARRKAVKKANEKMQETFDTETKKFLK